jgi:hypothetical protein
MNLLVWTSTTEYTKCKTLSILLLKKIAEEINARLTLEELMYSYCLSRMSDTPTIVGVLVEELESVGLLSFGKATDQVFRGIFAVPWRPSGQ